MSDDEKRELWVRRRDYGWTWEQLSLFYGISKWQAMDEFRRAYRCALRRG